MSVTCQISLGEFWDKYTIVEIKFERVRGAEKLRHVGAEYGTMKAMAETLPKCKHLKRLKQINETIWRLENEVRTHIADGNFGEGFVGAVRADVALNDERSRLKKQIDIDGCSAIIWEQEKAYVQEG